MQYILKITTVLAFIALSITGNTQTLIPFIGDNKKYGYKDDKNNLTIKPVYTWASGFVDGLAIVNLDNNRGYIDTKGKVLFPLQYEDLDFFYEGLARVKKDGKWGFVNKKGEIRIPLIYETALNFKDGFSEVMLNTEKYMINYAGEKNGPFIAMKEAAKKEVKLNNEKYKTINAGEKNGPPIVIKEAAKKPEVRKAIVLLAFKNSQNKFGYKNDSGRIVIKPVYDIANKFSEGAASVMLGLKWFIIDTNGNEVAALRGDYDFIGEFSEGFVVAVYNSKYGFLDRSGRSVIDFKYDEASDFVNGIATVELKGEKIKINKEGRRIY